MITQIEKTELARLLLSSDDESVIRQIKNLLINQIDIWDRLPDEVKEDIEISLKQLDKGLGIPHKDIMQKYDKWVSK